MDHIRILKRAFSITTAYRALWVFGILVALTAGGDFGGSSSPSGDGTDQGGFEFPPVSPEVLNTLIVAGIVAVCVALLLVVAAVILHNVSEVALIRMVDQHEATGATLSVRQGFRLGWSRAAWRVFLLDLLVGVTVLLTFLALLAMAASPLLLWLTDETPARILGTVVAVGLLVVVVFAGIVTAITLALLGPFWHRAVVLEDRSVGEALRRGWQLPRQRLGDVLIMGLIMFGLGLAWSFVMVPVVFLLLVVGALAGGLPALLVYAITGLITQGAAPGIAAAIVGVPIFIVIMAIPLLFLGGLAETFQSSTWTLTYRELLALEAARQVPGNGEAPSAPIGPSTGDVPPPAPA